MKRAWGQDHKQIFYRWRKEYGGMEIYQAKKLKMLEKENSRLKKLMADMALDNAMLKAGARLADFAEGNLRRVTEQSCMHKSWNNVLF